MAMPPDVGRPALRPTTGGLGVRLLLLLGAAWLAVPAPSPAIAQPAAFPPALERYLSATVKPSASERQRLLRGEPVTKLLEADPARDVAVFGAVWVEAPRHLYARAVIDIEHYERGRAFPVTRKIGLPPGPEDFAPLKLPDETWRGLASCRVGDCEVKLWGEAIEAVRRVNFAAEGARAEADAVLRAQLLEYVTRYVSRGNAALAEYRDDSTPVRSADELQAMLTPWPSLLSGLPELQRFLTAYPHAPWPGAVDFLYWQETRFGLKPVIRVNHFVVHEGEAATVVASKMLYASHYFRSALELRVLLPDPARGSGYWLVTISRSRPDGLTGLIGRLIRGRVRGEARKGVQSMLESAKRRLERAAAR